MDEQWIISERFRGPPDSGNGGYCAGVLAERLGGSAAVRLKAPIPLHVPLAFASDSTAAGPCERLYRLDDGQELAIAWPEPAEDQPPPLPDPEHLARLTDAFSRPPDGPFAHCFGCGEARRDGDAIRVLGGQLPGSGLSGSRWRAHENFADANGALAPRYVWTALDCTGGLAAQYLDPRPMLTGTMQVRIERPVMAGEEYAVLAWPIGQEGRKVITGTAIYDLSGTVQAVGRLIWITIPNY